MTSAGSGRATALGRCERRHRIVAQGPRRLIVCQPRREIRKKKIRPPAFCTNALVCSVGYGRWCFLYSWVIGHVKVLVIVRKEVGLVWLESRDFCESCTQASCWSASVHQCLRERRSPSRGTRPGRREACRGRHGGWLVSWLSCILSWDVRADRGRRRMLGFCD